MMKRLAKSIVKRGLSEANRAKQCIASKVSVMTGRTTPVVLRQYPEEITENSEITALFDADYYLTQYKDIAGSGADPLSHYLNYGRYEQRRAHPLFDPEFYLNAYGDVRAAGVAAIDHYFADGANEGRLPHPFFDTQYYLRRYSDVATGGMNALAHYACHGATEGRWPHPLFDPAYYRSQFVGGIDAQYVVDHYRTSASNILKSPHRLFDTMYYLSQSGPIPRGLTPLEHFLHTGFALGYSPHPLFDTAYYLNTNPDVASAGINPLIHYVEYGSAEDRSPHPLFDPKYYRQQSGYYGNEITALEHLIQTRNHFSPHPLFSPAFYLNQINPNTRHDIFAFEDYCKLNGNTGVEPHPLFQSLSRQSGISRQSTASGMIGNLMQAILGTQSDSSSARRDTWSSQLARRVVESSKPHSVIQQQSILSVQQQYARECCEALRWINQNSKH